MSVVKKIFAKGKLRFCQEACANGINYEEHDLCHRAVVKLKQIEKTFHFIQNQHQCLRSIGQVRCSSTLEEYSNILCSNISTP